MSVRQQSSQPSPAAEGAATASQRDNFTAATKRVLAQRVGWLCSNPACTLPTVGPEMGGPGTNNIGVAAHITAASEGFARYNARLTPEERKSADNGIWLCSNHAHMIDHDEKNFPVELLNIWKKDAEERAYQQLLGNGTARVERLGAELAEGLQNLKEQLGLPSADDLPTLQAKVSAAARTHLESFSREGPAHAVSLGLTTPGKHAPFSHVEMARALRACGTVSLVAEPGQGKSTTLNQLGIELLAEGPTPLFVPLAEVGAGVDDLFAWVISRHAFAGIRSEHLKFLAEHGELAFLFDGWNEVSPVARVALIRTLRALRREFPLLVMCVATRAQAGAVPFAARSMAIDRLSDAQQDDITRPHGERGHNLLDRVRRTPGVRDLARVPFYLQALLKVTDLGALPATTLDVPVAPIVAIRLWRKERPPVDAERSFAAGGDVR
ncbi:hypothetical protein [Mesorhizobium sp. M1348]|uniref:NACHT domain-containing protein n=1 Tax=unclassified Mesorhizobium TaxID=325217 RepID=UPI003334F44C